MDELSAADSDEVVRFLRRWYGDLDIGQVGTVSDLLGWPAFWSSLIDGRFSTIPVFGQVYIRENSGDFGGTTFWVDDEGDWEWSVPKIEEDAQVFERETGSSGSAWRSTGETMHRFLLHAALLGAVVEATDQYYARDVEVGLIPELVRGCSLVVSSESRCPAAAGKIFMGTETLIRVVDGDVGSTAPICDLVASSRSHSGVLNFISGLSHIPWKMYVRPTVRKFFPSEVPGIFG
ncbi:hypothetical protein [Saccharothrix violaceirubra]|uniref:Uncharacterized protein n=1 Tax=Saccharothrix violaceirubra TaxID=413306 RepID=A0A7W7WYU4_9PSEU|nr:hypothetical protein [Saccharothrix violaceirubra]MBB4968899.1 hypothetical protein [Saccharothrix violaceirubra]